MNNLLESAVGHSLLATRTMVNGDVDAQASALIYANWQQRYDQLSGGRFEGAMQEMRFPSFTLIRETSNRVLLQKGCTPKGVFAIGALMTRGQSGYHCGQMLTTRTAAVLEPGSEFEIRTPESFDLVAAVFSPRDLAANLEDPSLDYVELENELRRSAKTLGASHAGPMADFLQRVHQCGSEAPESLMVPSNLRQLEEEFYALLVDTLYAARAPEVHGPCPNRKGIVRRFQSYVDSAPESALNVAEICEEIGVTRRTLQNATQEVFGISPQSYLKAIRLNGFRRSLKQRDPHCESIGDLAARWGFWHLSHLAQDYRRLFGELPSQTPCIHIS
jgi:AraC family ethanolamine operon transcriptional activator